MTRTYINLLDGFLADPADPRWSSAAMTRMFNSVDGDSRTKLFKVLRYVDNRLADCSCALTTEQTSFLRDVTLFAYTSGCASSILLSDIDWLLARLQSKSTPQRALIIVLLIPCDKLPLDTRSLLLRLLYGTPGERFLETDVVGSPE
ncbi:MAG: hypothetical protein KDA91_18160 [Planctomycetaceae bacterium]|nr:hypothetical protein [Planctomycetaceae bacterium]